MAYTYIVCCKDNTFYTGATTDLESRIDKHNQGRGAKYTRARIPVKLVFALEVSDYSLACKYEYYIKQLTRKQKQVLIDAYFQNQSNEYILQLLLNRTFKK